MGEMHARLPFRSQRITYSDLKSIAWVIDDGLSRGRQDGRRQSHVVGPAGATSASQEASRFCFGEGQSSAAVGTSVIPYRPCSARIVDAGSWRLTSGSAWGAPLAAART